MAANPWQVNLMLNNYHVQTICKTVLEDLLAKIIPGPEVTDSESEVTVSEQEVTVSAPEVTLSESEVTVFEPAVSVFEPEVTVFEPEVTVSEPEVIVSESEVTFSEPEVTVSEPEVTVFEQEVTVSEPDDTVPELEAKYPRTKVTFLDQPELEKWAKEIENSLPKTGSHATPEQLRLEVPRKPLKSNLKRKRTKSEADIIWMSELESHSRVCTRGKCPKCDLWKASLFSTNSSKPKISSTEQNNFS